MDNLVSVEVEHNSPEYWETVRLRDIILRKPLGLEFTKEELLAENDQFHLALFDGKETLACLCLVKVSDAEVKMRQVAVANNQQGRGLGKKLVRFSEEFSKARGFTLMSLHARETAIPFYKKIGYATIGAPFMEVGITHYRMERNL